MYLKLDSWQYWWFISESPLIGMPILVSHVYVTVVPTVIPEIGYIWNFSFYIIFVQNTSSNSYHMYITLMCIIKSCGIWIG